MTPEVNQRFAQHVTSIAFNLQLSRAQIIMLVQIATRNPEHVPGAYDPGQRNLYRILGFHDVSVPAVGILIDKGLVYAPDSRFPGHCNLTEPGKLVFQLLQMAGLVQRIDEKVAEKEASK